MAQHAWAIEKKCLGAWARLQAHAHGLGLFIFNF